LHLLVAKKYITKEDTITYLRERRCLSAPGSAVVGFPGADKQRLYNASLPLFAGIETL
jgi:hypothetical protein